MAGSFQELYDMLMSGSPPTQSVGAAGWRNLAAAAQTQAALLRQSGATASENAGTSGAAAQAQMERHAQWFDTVSDNANTFATQMDHAVGVGSASQATAEEWNARVEQAYVANPGPSQGYHTSETGTPFLQEAVNKWGNAYSAMKPPTPPPAPEGSSSGSGGSTGGAAPAGGSGAGSGYHGELAGLPSSSGVQDQGQGPGQGPAQPPGTAVPVPINTGGAGSVTVGSDGGDFAGWFKDPRSGYYVDPSTGREFDPTSSRWIDPVTGLPFGDSQQYATKLEGLGGPSTTTGLLSASGPAGVGGAGWSSLFSGGPGSTSGLSGSYGGFLPPSLTSSNPAYRTSYAAARDNMAVKSATASRMLAREEATRTGRPYMPPMQSAAGAGAGGGRRASSLTSEKPLFSTASSRAAAARQAAARAAKGGAAAEEESATSSAGARRSYLPPTQAGGKGKDKDREGRERPDWLVEDDLWGARPAAPVILDEMS